jgi:hypothetical protein
MNQSNIFSTTTTRTAFNTSRLFGISTSDNVLLKVTLGFLPVFVNLHKRIVYRAENEESHNKVEKEETIATTATNNNNNNRLILHFHSTDDNEEEGYTPELEEMSECSMGSGWSTGTDDSSLFMYQQQHKVDVIGKKNKAKTTTTTTTEKHSVSSIAVDDEKVGRQVITGTRSTVSDISIASCSTDWDTVSMMTANQSIQDSGYLPSGSASVSSGGSTSFVDSFYNFAFTPSVNSSRRRQRIKRRNGRGKNKQKNDDVCSLALKEECGVIVEAEPSEDIDIESTMSI